MRSLFLLILAAALVIGGLIHDRSGHGGKAVAQGDVYDVPYAEARVKLLHLGLPPVVFDQFPPEYRVDGFSDPARIFWIVRTAENTEMMRLIVTMTAEGPSKTRVLVDLQPPQSGGHDEASEFDRPAVKNMYVSAMRENVAASLENRPVNLALITAGILPATIASVANIRQRLDHELELERIGQKAAIAKAYAAEGTTPAAAPTRRTWRIVNAP